MKELKITPERLFYDIIHKRLSDYLRAKSEELWPQNK